MLVKCRACDIMHIYPRGIYCYKEQGCDSHQVAFRGAVMDEKSLFPLFPVGGGSGYKQMTGA